MCFKKSFIVITVFIGSFIMLSAVSCVSNNSVFPGADEQTPSYAQYFSWINNTNEGSTEQHTLINLNFFKWLHDEYGMKLDIYAFDAGNIDAPRYYGSMDTEKYKTQFPNGFESIYQKAKSFDCRLGVWLGPDGYGDTPEEEQARIEMLEMLCKEYKFQLFKVDAVCTQLRPEKQDAFIETMKRCRKYSPDMIVLNHRLKLGKAEPYATTWLWEGAETYIDVHMANSQTAPHNRAGALSRGLVPDLKRLTEDHGVCLSSCLDFWEDDLILQAFNRGLILAPEIYANPWLLKDEEFSKLARIYNLHRKYRDILTSGMVLPEDQYGPNAVSRGDQNTRLITLRNLSWEPVTYHIQLDTSIGLKKRSSVECMQYHPSEKYIGKYEFGQTIPVTVQPFRSCLLLAEAKTIDEDVIIQGCDYEVVQNVASKPVKIKLLGFAGTVSEIKLATSRKFKTAQLNEAEASELLKGDTVHINFSGKSLQNHWHRKLGELKNTPVPADAEALYEATCFSADNNALEVRSLKRSGPTAISQVQKARDAFFNQPLFAERGIWDKYAFDGDSETSFDVCRRWEKYKIDLRGGAFRIDFGEPVTIDKLTIKCSTDDILDSAVAEISTDLKAWKPIDITTEDGCIIAAMKPGVAIRYFRMNTTPEKVYEVKAFYDGKPLDRAQWRCSNLFKPYQANPAAKSWAMKCRIDEVSKNSYLAVPIAGEHGLEGAWAAIRVGDKLIGAVDRAVSFPSNVWEYRSSRKDSNYTYYFPVIPDMLGKEIEVVVLALNPEYTDINSEVWLTAYPVPYDEKELILK